VVYVNVKLEKKPYYYNNTVNWLKYDKKVKYVYLDLTLGKCRGFRHVYNSKKHVTIFYILESIVKTDKNSFIEHGFDIWQGFIDLYNLLKPFYVNLAFNYDNFDYYKMRNIFEKNDLKRFFIDYIKIMETLRTHPYFSVHYKEGLYIPSFTNLDLFNVFHLANTLYFLTRDSFLYYNLEFKHDNKIRDLDSCQSKLDNYYDQIKPEVLMCHKAYGIIFLCQFSFDRFKEIMRFYKLFYITNKFPGINSVSKQRLAKIMKNQKAITNKKKL
jgi:hypothetical protein